ncbi:MAG TPA: guanylate kinase [Flavobacteriales bacterium]|nr:guanylate kinase [Flavobacteriales bacterium]HRE75734.1 guanylate kinase [Flavobacteriales bacterium]HRE95961.1 guanylate kinase [Flavobacteriales bacterium]HRJ34501.1 guanylate kinase [Flavobacteriales bacterium]HRJ38167.1 guanylate kinase [Flavobacteriales bacterium]
MYSDKAQGKAIIFSAPSGAGKTTIVHHLLSCNLGLEFSVSACSRAMRKGEANGVDYYFLSVEEFRKKIANKEFLEWEEVYTDHFYGTLQSEIERIWKKGHHVIFDVDVVGGINLKKIFGPNALSVFVKAPSIAHLEARLKTRSTETPESIARRMAKAEIEMGYAEKFDHILLNDDLQRAFAEAEQVVKQFLNS